MPALSPTPREDENGHIKLYHLEESYRKLNAFRKFNIILTVYRLLLYGIGIVWLLLLPLDDISGRVYTDENALMPGYTAQQYNGDHKVVQLTEQLNQVAWSVHHTIAVHLIINLCGLLYYLYGAFIIAS